MADSPHRHLGVSISHPVRVLIVDDDPVYRLILSKTFARIENVELVGSAPTLAIARQKLETGNIDLVTLDVVLRDESGLDLLPWIKKNHPHLTTVLLTAGTVKEARLGVDALLLGASTLVLKPSGPDAQRELTDALSRMVRGIRGPVTKAERAIDLVVPQAARLREVIAVGASTGGPPVVIQFLRDLPTSFEVPVLVTQHMPALHIPYFAEMVARETKRPVHLAHHGDPVVKGCVYIASDGKHMRIAKHAGRIVILQDDGPEEHNCRPAVDPLFHSVAQTCGAASVGVVMTGMGSDGAEGAVALRKVGAPVVIQDRASSVVWGMPGATAAMGASCEAVPASALATTVLRWTSGWSTQAREVANG